MIVWSVYVVLAVFAGIFYLRMQARAARDRAEPDTGLAILEFGRAFPNEAIRAVHATIDEKAVFLRLHDGKAGFMQNQGSHYLCHVIEPGKVRIESTPDERTMAVHFPDYAYFNGPYTFRTAEEAAEVSLWLLGSFRPASGFDDVVPDQT